MESFRARSAASTSPPREVGGTASERLAWIDWLKVIVVFGVFVYHAAEPFLIINWVVSNDERSVLLSALAGFGFLFGMPLMFLLTGATSWLSLGRRSLGSYAVIRIRRLLVPLVVGIVVLTPLQWWLAAAIARGGENPLNTIAWYFGGMRFEPTSRWFGDYGMHLWFIAFLLAYSLICLPLLAALRRPGGAAALDRLARMPTTALLLVLFLPILAGQWLLRIPAPDYRDWADFALWLSFFVVGVVLVADRRLLDAVVRSGPRLIGVGMAVIAVGLGVVVVALSVGLIPAGEARSLTQLENAPALDVPSLAYIAARTAAGGALTAGCLWIGVRRFRSRPSWLPTANRAILPFYVLHHPVVVAVAAVVVQWSIGVWAKVVLVLLASLVGSVALTGLAMATPVGRAIFGIPPDGERGPRAVPEPEIPAPDDACAIRTGPPVVAGVAAHHRNVIAVLHATVRRVPDGEALRWKEGGRWQGMTYAQLWGRIRSVSLGMQRRGVRRGDHVVILGRSRPEWVVADYAAMALGAVVCPIYPGESDARIEEIARAMRPRLLLVEEPRQLSRFGDIAPTVILGSVVEPMPGTSTVVDLERTGARLGRSAERAWRAGVDDIDRSAVATIVHTIDDEGIARGAVLTHGNVLHALDAAHGELPIRTGDVALSILPLSHMLERAGQLLVLANGATVAFAESRIDRWPDNMREVRPHVMVAVPLFLSHVVKGMRAASVARHGLVGRVARWGVAIGARSRGQTGRAGHRRSWFRLAVADLAVLRPLRAATGGRLRFVCCGGAPLPVDAGEFLSAVGIPVIEGYGMTEASPLLAMNRLGRQRLGTVGPPVAGTELRLEAGTGEILARGPQIMQGYHELPRQTSAALLPDGWLRTGDLGAWDGDGNLRIVGVRKDLLVLASGKKVSPGPLERAMEGSELIARAVMLDLDDGAIGVLVWPDRVSVRARAKLEGGASPDQLLAAEVVRLLGGRAAYERPRRLGILPRDLTAEAAELRPDGRLDRAVIRAAWGAIATIPLTWRARSSAHLTVVPSRVEVVSQAG